MFRRKIASGEVPRGAALTFPVFRPVDPGQCHVATEVARQVFGDVQGDVHVLISAFRHAAMVALTATESPSAKQNRATSLCPLPRQLADSIVESGSARIGQRHRLVCMPVDDIMKWLGWIVVIGTPLLLVAYRLLKWLGQRVIEQRLKIELERFKSEQQKDLEKFKSEQQKEVERLRHLLSSRISKIHEKEFEVLPTAWNLMHEAGGSAAQVLLQFKQYPDFIGMPAAQLEEFLRGSRLSDYQKDAFRSALDRNTYYREVIAAIDFDFAKEKHRVFHNYIIQQRIFMTDDLRKKFGVIDDEINMALSEHDIGKAAKDYNLQKSAAEKVSRLNEKIDVVDQAVQKRLHYEDA